MAKIDRLQIRRRRIN